MRKELFEDFFKGKKVTVIGLGLLGRGIGDTKFLAEHGAELIVTDKKSEEELKSSLEALKDFPNIIYRLGEHRLEDFEHRDFILKAAGVPLDNEYIAHAQEKGIPVYMSGALVADVVKKRLPHTKIIGVTGTRGKTTTTELIAHVLEQGGFTVRKGGNIRGLANLPLLETIEDGDMLVMELDSWQLQGFDALKLSPDISVFTSFLDDHLNYYKNDKELYFRDKASIYLHQKDGILIASKQAAEEIKKRHEVPMIVPELHSFESNLLGEHNQVSMALAYEVGKQFNLSTEVIRKAFASFEPVEGRLQYMGRIRGVHIYNDNNATTPDATISGINAIVEQYKQHPILICGGADKGIDLTSLEKVIQEKTKACIFLTGTGTDKIALPKDRCFDTLHECVQAAFACAEENDVILFSPGFASFSQYFKNEYERNDTFVEEIQKYV